MSFRYRPSAVLRLYLSLFVLFASVALFAGPAMAQVSQERDECLDVRRWILEAEDALVTLGEIKGREMRTIEELNRSLEISKGDRIGPFGLESREDVIKRRDKEASELRDTYASIERIKSRLAELHKELLVKCCPGREVKKTTEEPEVPGMEEEEPPRKPGQTGLRTIPKVELFAGYSNSREDGEPENNNLNGWNTSIAYNVNEWVAARADLSGFYRSENGTEISKHVFLFGPQFSYRPNNSVRIFARPLFGVARFNAETKLTGGLPPVRFSDTTFAMAFGGGVDVRVNKRLMVRLGQFDYQPTFFGKTRQDNFRFSTGLVFTFGRAGTSTSGQSKDSTLAPGTPAAAPLDVDDKSDLISRAELEAFKAKLKLDTTKADFDDAFDDGLEGATEDDQKAISDAAKACEDARQEAKEAQVTAEKENTPEARFKADNARRKARLACTEDFDREVLKRMKNEKARERYRRAREELEKARTEHEEAERELKRARSM